MDFVLFILIWDIWRRNIVLKENCEASTTIYDVWLYEYLVIYDLFAWAVFCPAQAFIIAQLALRVIKLYLFCYLAAVWYLQVDLLSFPSSLAGKLVLLDFHLTGELSRCCIVICYSIFLVRNQLAFSRKPAGDHKSTILVVEMGQILPISHRVVSGRPMTAIVNSCTCWPLYLPVIVKLVYLQ